MTRHQNISLITSKLAELSEDQLAALADMAQAFTSGTVYETLSDDDKAEIDRALDRLDSGKGVPWSEAKARLEARLKAAGV